MKGNQEIYQKTDVEHVFDGLGETPRIQYEVEVVQRSSSVPFELADQTFEGLCDQFLGSILRAGVAPVLVDVQGAGLPQSRVGLPGSSSPGGLLCLGICRLAGDGSVEKGRCWTSAEVAADAVSELDKAPRPHFSSWLN